MGQVGTVSSPWYLVGAGYSREVARCRPGWGNGVFERESVEISLEQLEAWVGRELTDDEVVRIQLCIPGSPIPGAIAAIVEGWGQCGFVCKRCGGPSPVGVGYVDEGEGAAGRSAGLSACGCGWSVLAR